MQRNSGVALVTVVCFMTVVSALLAVLVRASATHIRIARAQRDVEQALFVAEAGAERAAAHVVSGGNVPVSLSGDIGDGSYLVTVIGGSRVAAGEASIGGRININPNNSDDNEFCLTLGDGSEITRDDLVDDFAGYKGNAVLVHVLPKGNGNQNALQVNGEPYPLENGNTYDIRSAVMAVDLYNDKIAGNGKAVGTWWIAVAATSATIDGGPAPPPPDPGDGDGASYGVSMIAVGTVRGKSRMITIEGVRQKTWAKFALWMHDNRRIYFKSGEEFNGHVHSNNKLWFSGDPEFFSDCTSAASDFGGSTNACVFHKGLNLSAASDTMASVRFDSLRQKATLLVTGVTEIAFSGTNVLVTNERMGWNEHVLPMAGEALLYVESAGGGGDRYGDVTVSGDVDGRVTVAAERDISIVDDITYADDPKTNAASDDALGLIAMGDVIVTEACPDDVEVYAHIMATGQLSNRSGSFGVARYSSGRPRGVLTVHGGIVQYVRGAVGTFSTQTGRMVTGFEKNYTYDMRFASDPPPEYPPLSDDMDFGVWRDK